jgi:alanine racemase
MEFLKRSWAEISLSALHSNISHIKARIPSTTEIMAVVKADAYGHGCEVTCHKLNELGITHFAVSNINEAVEVRKICPDAEILILGYTPPEYSQLLEQYNIIQGVVSSYHARMLSANAKKNIRCHVKVDTGMGRIGVKCGSALETANEILEITSLPNLDIEGIYTHLAVADTDTDDCRRYTNHQIEFIKKVSEILKLKGCDLKHTHFLNSAGSINYTDPASTLARVGIIMYGLLPNYPEKIDVDLKPVMSLKSIVSHVKTIEEGTSVSYGRTFIANKKMDIATVTIGYADGYPRLLSGKADVLIHGSRCPIVGRICMDQLMVDVSHVKATVRPGDIVTLIGTDENETISADELASLIGTIGYEIVCGISKRVPRIIAQD